MPPEERILTPAYLWFDAEFTSLDLDHARLLQVALLVTDAALNRLTAPAQDVSLYIRLESDAPVSAWVEEHLAGVLAQCRSARAVPVEEADRILADRVDGAVGPRADDIKRRPVLAGNSVHMDMALARRFLPRFSQRLHYRMLDVSGLKILWQDWFRGNAFDKENADQVRRYLPIEVPADAQAGRAHDAFYDIQASLAELNYYRRQWGWTPDCMGCSETRGTR